MGFMIAFQRSSVPTFQNHLDSTFNQYKREKLQSPRCDDSMKSTSVFKAGEPRHSSSSIFCLSLSSVEDSSR